MKMKKIAANFLLLFTAIVFLASCEEEFTSIGANVIGDPDITSEFTDESTVIAYSRLLQPVQTNLLPAYQMGVYTDPTYGKSTVSLLSQVTLDSQDPDFGENPMVEDVTLYIPYFSTATQNTDGITYELDSIYGSNRIDISLIRSGLLLRDFDPNTGFQERQNYYSNQGPVVESFLQEDIFTIEDLVPSAEGFIENEDEEDEEIFTPGIRVQLPVEYFQTTILDQGGQQVLLNNNNFRDYFRGIYFKVDGTEADNFLFLFNITEASIRIRYTNDDTEPDDDPEEFNLTFQGQNVNIFENELNSDVANELSNIDANNGEENIYLRGGSGVAGVIELFGEDADNNGVADELEILRDRQLLINEANLIFYVDDSKIQGGETEPERVLIYDLKNNFLLIDYDQDGTASNPSRVDAYINHLGRLERGSDEIGDFYKIKVTSHISNIINNDSTNVPLGLVVSQNVSIQTVQDLRNMQSPFLSGIPTSSVLSPEGTVLFGNATANEAKRLKLQIYYTEPN